MAGKNHSKYNSKLKKRNKLLFNLSFNRLPFELREKILIYALYRTHPIKDIAAAMRTSPDDCCANSAQSIIKIGQRTLSALKLTSSQTYIDTISASRTWLDYEILDLFEELEAIRGRFFQLARSCKSPNEFRWRRDPQDRHREIRVVHLDLPRMYTHRRKLDNIERITRNKFRSLPLDGKLCTTTEVNLTDSKTTGDTMKYSPTPEKSRETQGYPALLDASDQPMSRLDKELMVCIDGVFVGHGELITPPWEDPFSVVGYWRRSRRLPVFEYGQSETYWYRPYRKPPRSCIDRERKAVKKPKGRTQPAESPAWCYPINLPLPARNRRPPNYPFLFQ